MSEDLENPVDEQTDPPDDPDARIDTDGMGTDEPGPED